MWENVRCLNYHIGGHEHRPLPRGTYRKVMCENRAATISCPAGRVIQIKSAMYGRTSRGVCPSRAIRTLSCRARSSHNEVAGNCNNRRSCQLAARNSIFGDPCGGTAKYLEVTYTCVSSGKVKCNVVCLHSLLYWPSYNYSDGNQLRRSIKIGWRCKGPSIKDVQQISGFSEPPPVYVRFRE